MTIMENWIARNKQTNKKLPFNEHSWVTLLIILQWSEKKNDDDDFPQNKTKTGRQSRASLKFKIIQSAHLAASRVYGVLLPEFRWQGNRKQHPTSGVYSVKKDESAFLLPAGIGIKHKPDIFQSTGERTHKKRNIKNKESDKNKQIKMKCKRKRRQEMALKWHTKPNKRWNNEATLLWIGKCGRWGWRKPKEMKWKKKNKAERQLFIQSGELFFPPYCCNSMDVFQP